MTPSTALEYVRSRKPRMLARPRTVGGKRNYSQTETLLGQKLVEIT